MFVQIHHKTLLFIPQGSISTLCRIFSLIRIFASFKVKSVSVCTVHCYSLFRELRFHRCRSVYLTSIHLYSNMNICIPELFVHNLFITIPTFYTTLTCLQSAAAALLINCIHTCVMTIRLNPNSKSAAQNINRCSY